MLRAVLVVDDASSGRQVIQHHLEHFGVQDITLARDGIEALNLIKSHPNRYKFIFTDLHMPNMDGMQLLRELGDLAYAGQVVVFSKLDMSIIKMAVSLARQKQVHLAGFLSKPIDEKAVNAMLQKLERGKADLPLSKDLLKKRQLLLAIEQESIVPYFQPLINAKTKVVVGFEVLCRIQLAEEKDLVLPERFIQVADKFKLAEGLFSQLLEKAALGIKQLVAEFPAHYQLVFSFNVSPSQLRDEQLPEKLMAYCRDLGISNECLNIEITETEFKHEFEMLMTLERLRIHGFGLSLDDFGKGFTNLADLCRLPFTEIKLDQSYVRNISNDPLSQVVFKSLCDISRELDVTLVAEGVDNNRDFSYIAEQGKSLIQGHLVSRPKPADEVARWLSAWNHNWNIAPESYRQAR